MEIILLVVFGYLIGSVPVGFIFGTLSGVDVRQAGSGNVGATNVARVVGKWQGLATLVGDVAKGSVPAFLSLQLGFTVTAAALVGLAAFLGHLYPVFLKFKGGKGVATAFGVFLILAPMATLILVFVFFFVAMASRVVSLASVVATGAAPVVLWLFSYPLFLVALSFLIGSLIVFRHRENIQRLVSGVEPRFEL